MNEEKAASGETTVMKARYFNFEKQSFSLWLSIALTIGPVIAHENKNTAGTTGASEGSPSVVNLLAGSSRGSSAQEYEPDSLLLVPAAGSRRQEIDSILSAVGAVPVKETECLALSEFRVLKVRTRPGFLEETKKELEDCPLFAAVQLNNYLTPHGVVAAARVDDPYYPMQWQHGALRSTGAWALAGGKAEPIAIVDVGLLNPADTEINLLSIFKAGQNPPASYEEHGHLMAFLAAARRNDKQGAGIAPGAGIHDVPAAAANSNSLRVDDEQLIDGLNHCMQKGIRIVSLSLNDKSCPLVNSQGKHAAVRKLFEEFHDKYGGIIVNSAAGSAIDHSEKTHAAMVVCGLRKDGTVFDSDKSSVFVAPAQDVCAGERTLGGTSCAAALCAGVVSLVWGANPHLKNSELEKILEETAMKISYLKDGHQAFVMLPDAERAVRKALEQSK